MELTYEGPTEEIKESMELFVYVSFFIEQKPFFNALQVTYSSSSMHTKSSRTLLLIIKPVCIYTVLLLACLR